MMQRWVQYMSASDVARRGEMKNVLCVLRQHTEGGTVPSLRVLGII